MKKFFLICLLFLVSFSALGQPDDLLPPDEAFRFSAEPLGNNKVRLEWKVADGYYLYRKKFAFESRTPGITLQDQGVNFPQGDIKNDPNFGDLEVYHQDVVLEVPINRDSNGKQTHELEILGKYQGCANAGLCFPPQRKSVTLQLAAADTQADQPAQLKTASDTAAAPPPATEKPAKTAKPVKKITNNDDIIPVDEAFGFNLVALDQHTLVAHWDVAPEHHLYRTKIKFAVKSPETLTLGEPLFPEGTIIEDEYFGTMEVFTQDLDVSVPLQNTQADQPLPEEALVVAEYQGCSDATGICYPPVRKEITLKLSGLPETASLAEQTPTTTNNNAGDEYSIRMENAGFFGTIAMFFAIGLLLAFTPCIFPMIPILSGVIAGQANLSARNAFLLSLAYVVASATAYAIIGIVFGIFGANLQSALQHPVAIASFAALFVILALSMFGFFDLQLPSSLQSRLNELSNKQQSGSLFGAAIMGFLSTLIVGPCVAPPLAGALTYIAQTKDALLGGVALFTMGFSMGIPLLIVGTSAGHLLPRAGAWMDTTKAIFGIMMLGLAIWMLNRIIPIELTMAMTGILLVASGIHMGALDKLGEDSSGWGRFWKSVGMILLFYGAMQLLGVASGSTNLLQPLKGVFAGGSVAAQPEARKLAFQRIKSVDDLERMLNIARQNRQPVMLDFYADWCTECIRMEKNTFSDSAIQEAAQGVLLLQADVTDNDEADIALEKQLGIIGPPSIIFFNKNGEEINDLRLVGYEDKEAFGQRLQTLHTR